MRAKSPDRVVKEMGRRVAELRAARGLTQEQFAERAGYTVQYQQQIEG